MKGHCKPGPNEFTMKLYQMKSTKLLSTLLLAIAMLFAACEDDSETGTLLMKASVTTASLTSVSENSAVIGGNVTDDGNASVTERGIVYATFLNPTTVRGTKLSAGSGLGGFSANLSGLDSDVTYYARAFAINSQGTSYGDHISFTTLGAGSLPIVTTTPAIDITGFSAVIGGNVSDEGGSPVTERGLVFGTSSNPTTDDVKIADGNNGLGSFTLELTGLNESSTYYVRAYAINGDGTAYGNEIIFSTEMAADLPTVSTLPASNITAFSALLIGNVSDDGGSPVTEGGFVMGPSSNPTTDDIKITYSGSITVGLDYSIELTGLNENSTYFVRAYAINDVGTAYGNEIQISTLEDGLMLGERYQGGVIGYILQPGDRGYDPDMQHGIIVGDLTMALSWLNGANNYLTTGATSRFIGDGAFNTSLIVDEQAVYGSGNNYAAKYCLDLNAAGFGSWHLPSSDELEALFDNRGAIGGFESGNYWSSTEINDREAFAVSFGSQSSGNQFRSNKNSEHRVRPVRYF